MVFMIHHEGGIRPYETGAIRNVRPRAIVESVKAAEGISKIGQSQESSDSLQTTSSLAITRYQQALTTGQFREPALKAKDVMSSPVSTLDVNTTIEEAFEFFKLRRFRHVPVIEQDSMVGILSDRDLLTLAAERARSNEGSQLTNTQATTVREIMSTLVLSAHLDTPIHDVARIMFEERIGCIPVVSDQNILVGIVTRSDILRCVMNRAPIELWT